jgi:putative transposase
MVIDTPVAFRQTMPMARQLRLEFPGAIYHVLNRGDRREDIFLDDEDRQRFEDTLGETCVKTGWQVHAFCLMPNHFHLVVETPQPNLVTGMKWLLGTYTTRFNRRHNLTGHLFAGRYKSTFVGGEGGYLRTVCDYIHLNPIRAQLLPTEAPLRSFVWSSFPSYLGPPAQRPRWLCVDRLFSECRIPADSAVARRKFEQRMEDLRTQDLEDDFKPIRRAWCFGEERFRKEIVSRVATSAGPHHYGAEIRESEEEKANRILLEELRQHDWQEEHLEQARKGDSRKVEIARRLRNETTMTLDWIARRLRMGTRGHLAHLLYWRARREQESNTRSRSRIAEVQAMPDPHIQQENQFDLSFD